MRFFAYPVCFLFLLDAAAHHIGYFRNGDESGSIGFGNEFLYLGNLEAVYHKIDDAVVRPGKIALCGNLSDATTEFLG